MSGETLLHVCVQRKDPLGKLAKRELIFSMMIDKRPARNFGYCVFHVCQSFGSVTSRQASRGTDKGPKSD